MIWQLVSNHGWYLQTGQVRKQILAGRRQEADSSRSSDLKDVSSVYVSKKN
jgi:hypothetical protein